MTRDKFLERINVLSADGKTSLSGGWIKNIKNLLVSGDRSTQQLLNLHLGNIASPKFMVRLDFKAWYKYHGRNTPEYLIASLHETPEVPLPAAAPLFLMGLAGAGYIRLRKKQKA